jgi:hypothetical protein
LLKPLRFPKSGVKRFFPPLFLCRQSAVNFESMHEKPDFFDEAFAVKLFRNLEQGAQSPCLEWQF